MGAIEKLDYSEEGRLELEKKIGELTNRLDIIAEARERNLKNKSKNWKRAEFLTAGIPTSRRRLQWSGQADYIIGLAQPPEAIGPKKERLAPRFEELGNSGNETHLENGAQGAEDQESEIGPAPPLAIETVPKWEKCPRKEESIIKQKMRVGASPLEQEIDSGGKFPPSDMMRSGIGDTAEMKQVLLVEFKTQLDVKMYSQFSDYGDYRGCDFPGSPDLSAIPKRRYEGLANKSRPALKHHLFSDIIIPKEYLDP